MTSDTRIPPTEVTGAYGALVKFAARKMMGRVPDSVGVLWHNQAVMKDAMGIGRKIEGWRELDPDLASYAAMASAATIGCSFCLDLNYFMAHNHGLDEAKVREVPRWRESSVFTAARTPSDGVRRGREPDAPGGDRRAVECAPRRTRRRRRSSSSPHAWRS